MIPSNAGLRPEKLEGSIRENETTIKLETKTPKTGIIEKIPVSIAKRIAYFKLKNDNTVQKIRMLNAISAI